MKKPHQTFSAATLRQFADQGLSQREIAGKLNRHLTAVRRALKAFGIRTHAKRGGDRRSPEARGIPVSRYGVWPEGIHFTSLNFKPSPVLKPRGVEERSWCGCASGDCAALGEAA